jgi:hypothetical protein
VFFTSFFVFVTTVASGKHYKVIDSINNFGSPRLVSVVRLGDFGKEKVIFGFRDIIKEACDGVGSILRKIRRVSVVWELQEGRNNVWGSSEV